MHFVQTDFAAARLSGSTGPGGSAMAGCDTLAIFSSAEDADWKVLNWEGMSCMGSEEHPQIQQESGERADGHLVVASPGSRRRAAPRRWSVADQLDGGHEDGQQAKLCSLSAR